MNALRLEEKVPHLPDTQHRRYRRSPAGYYQAFTFAVLRVLLLQNRKNTTGRMELKKYNKYLKRVTMHKEIK